MALQTSGQISLGDIQTEFGGSNPIAISEYYGVGDTSGAQPTGLTTALFTASSNSSVWINRSIDISIYEGHTVRPVFLHTGMSGFRADLQLDNIGFGTSLYTFSANATGWQTSGAGNQLAYLNVSNWINVGGVTNGRWCRDQGGTSSSSTGLTTDASGSSSGWYLYTEVTSNFASANKYWLRGPETVITSSNSTFNFSEARYGSNIGTLTAYLYVTAQPSGGGTAPASGTISLSDFYGLSAPPPTTVVTAGDNGYYSYGGFADNVQRTSSNTLNIGSATGKLLVDGSAITGIAGITNPGRSGVDIWATGSGGNSGWTSVAVSGTVAGANASGGFTRANCTYTADTQNLSNWDRYWVNNYGGASTNTYTGTHPQRIIFGRVSPQTILNHQSTWVFS